MASLMPAGPAGAATRTATSPATGMTLSLDGAQVTVSPGARVSTAFLASVQGRAVTVACISGVTDLIAMVDDLEEGALTVSRPFDASILGVPARWPASSTSLSATLPRDVSSSADGCVVSGPRNDLAATFAFTAVGQELLAEAVPEQKLHLAHAAAKAAARARSDHRFPPARRLAAAIAASEPQLEVGFARNRGAARRQGVVYVVGNHTTIKHVELSYREDDGIHRLSGRRRGGGEVSQSGGESGTFIAPD